MTSNLKKNQHHVLDKYLFLMEKGLPFLGPMVLIFCWYLITVFNVVPPLLVPSPIDTFRRLYTIILYGDITQDIGSTVWRWALGFFLGSIIGIPVGLLLGSSRIAYKASYFILDFFRSLPVTALFPLFLLLFGIGDSSKIAMAFSATVFVVILNTAYGVTQAKKTRIRAAKVFGASQWQLFKWVIFFEALPQTWVGMRTSLSLALIVVIVSEMFIGTKTGLGQRVFDAYTSNFTEQLYAVLLLIGILGFLANRLFVVLEQRVIFWVGE